jgi:hypothetical protein
VPGEGAVTGASFDPAAHTVAVVRAYVTEHSENVDQVRDAEAAGKARSTLLAWLDAR